MTNIRKRLYHENHEYCIKKAGIFVDLQVMNENLQKMSEGDFLCPFWWP